MQLSMKNPETLFWQSCKALIERAATGIIFRIIRAHRRPGDQFSPVLTLFRGFEKLFRYVQNNTRLVCRLESYKMSFYK